MHPHDDHGSDDRLFGGGRRPLTIGLVLVVTGIAFEALAVATVMPEVARDLDGLRLYGWAFSAFMLAHVAGVAVAGPIGDHRGPAQPFAVGLVLFGAGLLLGGLAPVMPLVVVGRAVQGLGAGAVMSMAYVAMGHAYPAEARARLFAVLSTAWVVPGMVGPAVAGAVADSVGWRAVFLGLVPMLPVAGVLTLPVLHRLGPDGPVEDRPESRVADAVRLAAGAGVVVAGLGSSSLPVLVASVAAGLAVGARSLGRLVPAGTFRSAGPLPSAAAVRALTGIAFFATEAFVPLALTSLRGWSTTEAGLVLSTSAVTWAAGSWVQTRLGPAWGHRRVGRAGAALVAVGVVGMALVLVRDVPALVAVPAWAAGGLGMG
ncbi:MAG TPA: MFS transporter, partial [Acidimicrobiales bacterium]|nr:MFS transporter [Acidimicrobiales bacterium]